MNKRYLVQDHYKMTKTHYVGVTIPSQYNVTDPIINICTCVVCKGMMYDQNYVNVFSLNM